MFVLILFIIFGVWALWQWRRYGAAHTVAEITIKTEEAVETTKAVAHVAKEKITEVNIPEKAQKAKEEAAKTFDEFKKEASILYRSFKHDIQTERNRLRKK